METIAETPTPPGVYERVARGADMLDKNRPGWEHQINLEILDMNDPYKCVLGQLQGEFFSGLRTIEDNGANSFDYGFDVHHTDQNKIFYGDLDEAWFSQIMLRREPPSWFTRVLTRIGISR